MRIKIHDKYFSPFIRKEVIARAILKMAKKINVDLKAEKPIFIPVLNGSFMFAADLLKKISIDSEISFVKLASYQGTRSTGKPVELIGLGKEIKGRTVLFLEDIVDTGHTIKHLVDQAKIFKPKKILFATLLFKPSTYRQNIEINYKGIEIPNDFVVGFGLDYDGLGRNLDQIYKES